MRFPILYLVIGLAVVRAAPTPVDLDDPSSSSPSMSPSSPVAETQHLVSRGKRTILLIYRDPIFGPGVDDSLHAHRTDQITGVLFSRLPGVQLPLKIDAAGYPRNIDSFSGVVVGLAGCKKGCEFVVEESQKKPGIRWKLKIIYPDGEEFRGSVEVPPQKVPKQQKQPSTTGTFTTHFSQDEYDRLLKRFEGQEPGFVSPHHADLAYWLDPRIYNSFYPFLAAQIPQPHHFTHYAPPITHYAPPITHYAPPITHYAPPSYQQYTPPYPQHPPPPYQQYPPPPYSQHLPPTYAHY
ncbi:hypothetical protein C8R42DRAFT_723955 [Lentinula raphanica]|nr:hypothetical protein C8R42DRAFT_723955 [Lentinula raphanica]